MGTTSTSHISIQDYLRMEASAEVRHEFHRGEVYAMAGGTFNHSVLGTNITTELSLAARKNGCTTFNGDMRIRIDSMNCFLYPEVSVVCGEAESSQHDPNTIINPSLIVEVLSESTEAYDRGEKFFLYQQLESFREYVLIDQHKPLVSHFFKHDDGIWEFKNVYGLDQLLRIEILKVDIPLATIFRDTRDLKTL
ncbi:MAG: Uma2 family endonuclease [Bacteroidia bacterium]|nr:Uma2 family endonuclease [Bacteroidia bacterium]